MVRTFLVVANKTRGIRRYGRPKAIRLSRSAKTEGQNHPQARQQRKIARRKIAGRYSLGCVAGLATLNYAGVAARLASSARVLARWKVAFHLDTAGTIHTRA